MAAAHHAVATIAATESDAIIEGEGIDVRHGWASFRSPTRLEVDGAPVSGSRFVIATGAGPAVPPIPGLADLDYLTNETVFDLGDSVLCHLDGTRAVRQVVVQIGMQVVMVARRNHLHVGTIRRVWLSEEHQRLRTSNTLGGSLAPDGFQHVCVRSRPRGAGARSSWASPCNPEVRDPMLANVADVDAGPCAPTHTRRPGRMSNSPSVSCLRRGVVGTRMRPVECPARHHRR